MPVKRRLPKMRTNRITPEAVAAFVAEDEDALHLALDLWPGHVSPLFVKHPEPPPDEHGPNSVGPAYHYTWAAAWELRQELEQAAGDSQ